MGQEWVILATCPACGTFTQIEWHGICGSCYRYELQRERDRIRADLFSRGQVPEIECLLCGDEGVVGGELCACMGRDNATNDCGTVPAVCEESSLGELAK